MLFGVLISCNYPIPRLDISFHLNLCFPSNYPKPLDGSKVKTIMAEWAAGQQLKPCLGEASYTLNGAV